MTATAAGEVGAGRGGERVLAGVDCGVAGRAAGGAHLATAPKGPPSPVGRQRPALGDSLEQLRELLGQRVLSKSSLGAIAEVSRQISSAKKA